MKRPPLHSWRWLLWAYPTEFRYEYGSEIAQDINERWQEERGVSRIRFCCATIADVVATASKERYRMIVRDLIHSGRRLAAHPGIAAVAILSLALGIGANTTMFSIVYAALLRPLPYPDSERRVMIMSTALNSSDRANRYLATSADFIDWRASSETLEDWHMFTGRGAGTSIYPLLGAVGFVLLIACTNVANLLLARAAVRRREISVRAALGAGRHRLIREFLADGVVLAVPGVILGLLLAFGGIVLFRAVAPLGFPRAASVEVNLTVLAFTTVAGLLAGLLSAIFPAVQATAVDLTESLKEGARGSAGRTRQRLRSMMVAGEIALALVLLMGAGLTIHSLFRLQNHSLGFDPRNVTVAQLHLSGRKYMTDAPQREIDMRYVEPAVALFVDHLLRETRALPGVENAAVAGSVPMGPSAAPGVGIRVSGSGASEDELRRSEFNVVTDGFFETLRIPLLRGRYLNERDVEGGAWVAVVNEAFAREFFPDGAALGQVITLVAGPGERPREIVGVAGDAAQFTPRVPVRPEVFTSYLQQTREIPGNFQGQRFRPKLILRSRIEGAVWTDAITRIVGQFDKDLVIWEIGKLERHVALRGAPLRFFANALGLFSAIALVLAAIGIYGLISYSVTDRFHEIGIRVSLGASRARILRLIVLSGLKLTAAGLVLGLAGALATTRLLTSVLFEVKPWDPFTFAVVAVFLLVVSTAACTIPAMRATLIDPVLALRRE